MDSIKEEPIEGSISVEKQHLTVVSMPLDQHVHHMDSAHTMVDSLALREAISG